MRAAALSASQSVNPATPMAERCVPTRRIAKVGVSEASMDRGRHLFHRLAKQQRGYAKLNDTIPDVSRRSKVVKSQQQARCARTDSYGCNLINTDIKSFTIFALP